MSQHIKPIIFSTSMVQAILNGRKIQTRRPINPQPDADYAHLLKEGRWEFSKDEELCNDELKPKYSIGDLLWVRETWDCVDGQFAYRADNAADRDRRWKPSIFMPREAARLFLGVTDVRAQRLQDISEADAIAEGAFHPSKVDQPIPLYRDGNFIEAKTCRDVFSAIWNGIYAKHLAWDKNPWVWIYTFVRVTAEGEVTADGK